MKAAANPPPIKALKNKGANSKILSKMDIAESRKPQDGRIRLTLENKNLDIRVSSFPTIHGENIVMRLLDKSAILMGLKETGLLEKDIKTFEKLIRQPHGIIFMNLIL